MTMQTHSTMKFAYETRLTITETLNAQEVKKETRKTPTLIQIDLEKKETTYVPATSYVKSKTAFKLTFTLNAEIDKADLGYQSLQERTKKLGLLILDIAKIASLELKKENVSADSLTESRVPRSPRQSASLQFSIILCLEAKENEAPILLVARTDILASKMLENFTASLRKNRMLLLHTLIC